MASGPLFASFVCFAAVLLLCLVLWRRRAKPAESVEPQPQNPKAKAERRLGKQKAKKGRAKQAFKRVSAELCVDESGLTETTQPDGDAGATRIRKVKSKALSKTGGAKANKGRARKVAFHAVEESDGDEEHGVARVDSPIEQSSPLTAIDHL